jgi:hypothetical protein
MSCQPVYSCSFINAGKTFNKPFPHASTCNNKKLLGASELFFGFIKQIQKFITEVLVDLHNVGTDDVKAFEAADDLEGCLGGEATTDRGSGSGGYAGIETIDVKGEVDGLERVSEGREEGEEEGGGLRRRRREMRPMIWRAVWVVRPPQTGVPVPGATLGSRQSTKVR